MSSTLRNTHTRSFSSLTASRNARSRIFVPGSDPMFGRRRDWTRATHPAVATVAPMPTPRLWDLGLLDRLQAPLTRYHD